jgi:hypothetical protein
MAEPLSLPLVQLLQVMSANRLPVVKAVPSGREPVRMSCVFGFSVRP